MGRRVNDVIRQISARSMPGMAGLETTTEIRLGAIALNSKRQRLAEVKRQLSEQNWRAGDTAAAMNQRLALISENQKLLAEIRAAERVLRDDVMRRS
jgi:hypothetical protein